MQFIILEISTKKRHLKISCQSFISTSNHLKKDWISLNSNFYGKIISRIWISETFWYNFFSWKLWNVIDLNPSKYMAIVVFGWKWINKANKLPNLEEEKEKTNFKENSNYKWETCRILTWHIVSEWVQRICCCQFGYRSKFATKITTTNTRTQIHIHKH